MCVCLSACALDCQLNVLRDLAASVCVFECFSLCACAASNLGVQLCFSNVLTACVSFAARIVFLVAFACLVANFVYIFVLLPESPMTPMAGRPLALADVSLLFLTSSSHDLLLSAAFRAAPGISPGCCHCVSSHVRPG